MFQTAAAEKRIALRVQDTAPGLVVSADSERIMQVLSNIVGSSEVRGAPWKRRAEM